MGDFPYRFQYPARYRRQADQDIRQQEVFPVI